MMKNRKIFFFSISLLIMVLSVTCSVLLDNKTADSMTPVVTRTPTATPTATPTITPTQLISVAYVTDTDAAIYANDTIILPSLKNDYDFSVTEVHVHDESSIVLAACNAADLVIISEVCPSSSIAALKGIDKPVIMMKVHTYNTSSTNYWQWTASTNYGINGTETSIVVANTAHPIFTGVNFVNTNEVIILSSIINAKGLTWSDPSSFVSVSGGTINSIANIKNNSANICILEIPEGTSINGTLIQKKLIQIGYHAESYAYVTNDGLRILKNACYYLTNKDIPSGGASL